MEITLLTRISREEFIYGSIEPRINGFVESINKNFGKKEIMKGYIKQIKEMINFIEGDKKCGE